MDMKQVMARLTALKLERAELTPREHLLILSAEIANASDDPEIVEIKPEEDVVLEEDAP